jgi:hypothetical protein
VLSATEGPVTGVDEVVDTTRLDGPPGPAATIRARQWWATPTASGVLTVAVILVLASCAPPYQGNLQGPKVAILSDSMLAGQAGSHLQFFLGDTHQTSCIAICGRASWEMVGDAQLFSNEADVAVISLGINDARHITYDGHTIANTYDNGFTPVRDAFSNAGCVVYVTVDEQMPGVDSAVLAKMNDWWELHALYWPHRYRLADWNSAINYFGGWRNLTTDGVHPNSFGAQVLAEIIEAQVNACS